VIEKILALALFPFCTSMRIMGVIVNDSMELLEEIGVKL
jgi:hypothetical protein